MKRSPLIAAIAEFASSILIALSTPALAQSYSDRPVRPVAPQCGADCAGGEGSHGEGGSRRTGRLRRRRSLDSRTSCRNGPSWRRSGGSWRNETLHFLEWKII